MNNVQRIYDHLTTCALWHRVDADDKIVDINSTIPDNRLLTYAKVAASIFNLELHQISCAESKESLPFTSHPTTIIGNFIIYFASNVISIRHKDDQERFKFFFTPTVKTGYYSFRVVFLAMDDFPPPPNIRIVYQCPQDIFNEDGQIVSGHATLLYGLREDLMRFINTHRLSTGLNPRVTWHHHQ